MRRPPSETLTPALSPILSPSLPTLLIFECVLCYVSPEASAALFQWFVDYCATSSEGSVLGGIVYEMFGLKDSFGKVMQDNLKVCPSVIGLRSVPNKRFAPVEPQRYSPRSRALS